MPRERAVPVRKLRQDPAVFPKTLVNRAVRPRIADVCPAPEDGEGPASGVERTLEGVAVDPHGHTADDLYALCGQLPPEGVGLAVAVGAAHARADDGDGRAVLRKRAEVVQLLRRVREDPQARRIFRTADGYRRGRKIHFHRSVPSVRACGDAGRVNSAKNTRCV